MTEEQILEAIADACDDNTLCFQLIIAERVLHVYINRPIAAELDYPQLESKIYHVVSSHYAGEFEELALYCRILGQTEPDWQANRAIEAEVDSEAVSAMMEAITSAVDATNSVVARIEQELTEPESIAADSNSDFEELPTTADDEGEISHDALESIDDAVLELDLKQYCFIRNQRLLDAELAAPQATIARLINTFDRFESAIKRLQLPALELYFERSVVPDLSGLDPEVQVWWTEVATLDAGEQRKLGIWLSRYCLHPAETRAKMQSVLEAQQAREIAANETKSTKQSFPTSYPDPAPSSGAQPQQPSASSSDLKINILIPLVWAIVTVIIIAVGLNSQDAYLTEDFAICDNATGESSYCQLAAQIATEETLAASVAKAVDWQPDALEKGIAYCEFQANIKAGLPFKRASTSDHPLLSSGGSEIFPGIYLADLEQSSYRTRSDADTVRTACIFQQGNSGSSLNQFDVDLIAIETIDPAWPEVAYEPSEQKRTLLALNKTLGAYGVLGKFGLNTFYSAIMIYVLAVLGMAIRANSLSTIYQAAFVLGVVELLLTTLPVLGWWIKIPIECVALGITSALVRGFKVDWHAGYHFVAATALLLIASRWLLCWLTLGLLFAIFG